MSADTFTGIARFKDWYRICFGQAPDNLCDEYAEESIPEYFSKEPIYSTLEEAIKASIELENEVRDSHNDDWMGWFENEYGTIKFDFTNITNIDRWQHQAQ
jgi:hypothetical protein